MLELLVPAVMEGALLAAVIILREPKLLIPAVIIGLPIEYFGTRALGSLGESGAGGAVRALLNPGKAAMLATIGVAVFRARHHPRALFPDSMVLLPVAGLLALIILGLFWSDSTKAPNSVLILPMYVAFLFAAPSLIEDRRDVERIVGAFLVVACVLGTVALAQRLGGVFNWRDILIGSDGYTYRSNATFADPNHLARYFAIALSLAAGLVLATGPRRQTVYLALPALVLGFGGTIMTASRSGWLSLVLCTAIVMLTAPITRSTKLRLFGSAGTAVAIGLVFLLSQGGANADRIRTLTDGVQVLGSREFLIRAGMQMWRDNPFAGVGSGNFQHALVVSYLHLIPSWAQTTLSHTSVVSILAELGVVGAAMFAFVAFRAGLAMARAYFVTRVAYERLIIGWLAAGMLGIILQSQSEGRLLDDPFLWLLLAIFVAVETGAAFGGHARAASEQSPAHVAPAPGAGLPARPVPMRQPGAVARAPRQEPGA